MNRSTFAERYGPWAVIAGASEGLGAAFARELAARHVNLVLLARRANLLDTLAADIRASGKVEVRPLALDLTAADLAAQLAKATEGLEVGLGIYNAAFAPLGAFVQVPLTDKLRVLEVNCRGPVIFADVLTRPMSKRGRGGLVLMSSLAGLQGTASLATYSASKSFNRTLAEALWQELRAAGVDVVGCCAGAILTPGFNQAAAKPAPGTLSPAQVARQTLDALGKGPIVIPGRFNRFASFVMARVLPRTTAVRIMASTTAKVVPAKGPADPQSG